MAKNNVDYSGIRKELGEDLYLWGVGSKGPTYATQSVMISSHGRAMLFGTTWFTVPHNVTISFLGPQGATLIDPGFEEAATSAGPRASTQKNKPMNAYEEYVSGSICPDYYLTKYQGSHSKGGESYEDINDFLGDPQERDSTNAFARFPMDILTVRNRGKNFSRLVGMTISLSQAVNMLTGYSYRYEKVVCCFCRGYFGIFTRNKHHVSDNPSTPTIRRPAPAPPRLS